MNLAGFDLNLLLAFDAIMRDRHVTRAASRIGMTQPALSNALSRLRHHLNDELFVRTRDGMVPTPRALELAGPVRAALDSLGQALGQQSFDPLTSDRQFSIGLNDYAVTTLFPTIVRRLETEGPGIRLRLVPSAGRTEELLDARDIDFGISAFDELPERFGSASLIDDSYVLLMRRGHPLANGKLTLETYAQARHMLMSPRGDPRGFVDRALAEHGLQRSITLTINSFSSAAPLLSASDLIMTTPQRVADAVAPLYDLVQRPAPFMGPKDYANAVLVWHTRFSAHPAQDWMRDFLITCAREA